ncbi:hypothetical protein [Streptomyces sp. NBC_00005]|uniref:hypothetical protein n=1 Tax=Streptomyces sp. NBC_00005 TaxID=2903609 RepID=UPI00324F122D
MTHIEEAVRIVSDPDLQGLAKRGTLFEYLSGQSDRGLAASVECLLETDDYRIAEYVGQYLEVTPNASAEKERAAVRLRQEPKLARGAARLVPWLSTATLNGFIADYVNDAELKAHLSSVIFSIGAFRPELLRPFADLDHPMAAKAMLAGAPDEVADSLARKWRSDEDDEDDPWDTLVSLALIRTDHALEIIGSLRDELDDPADWITLVELAGGLPDSEQKAGYWPAQLAFLAEGGKSEHKVGGSTSGDVPICHICSVPAVHLLTLSASALPFSLSNNPSFYWYACDCGEMDSATVRIADGERTVYYGPKGPADPAISLTPGQLSLTLEKHPNQVGVSLKAAPSQSLNQVGGLPRWVDPDIHPRCPECGLAMPFVASVGGRDTPVGRIAVEGIVYCFWCDGCCVSSTKFQE